MGEGSSLIHRNYFANLLLNYADQITILSASLFDPEAQLFQVRFSSKKLPAGYNNQLDIISEFPELKFKPDVDV
jgi:hypothetical protein